MKKFSFFVFIIISLLLSAFLNEESGIYEHIYANKQFKIGFKYFSLGHYKKALSFMEKAYEYNRQDTAFIYWIARTNYELYNFHAADTYINMIPGMDENLPFKTNILKKLSYFSNAEKIKFVSLDLLTDTLIFSDIRSKYPEYKLIHPTSIVLGPGDRKYILSSENNVIFVLNVNNNLERVIALGHGIKRGYDFTFVNEDIWVTDFEGDFLYIYDKNGKFIKRFGGSGRENGKFYGPKGLFFFNGFVYVVDSGNRRIQKFDTSGNLMEIYQVNYGIPVDVVAYKDSLFVSVEDISEIRKGYFVKINLFTGENQLISPMYTPRGMFLTNNKILISCYFGERLYIYNLETEKLKSLSNFPKFTEDIAFDGYNLYALNYPGSQLLIRYNKSARHMLNCDIKEIYMNNLPLVVLRVRFMDANFKPIENLTKQNIAIYENGKPVEKYDIRAEEYDKFYYTIIVNSKEKSLIEQMSFLISHLKNAKWRIIIPSQAGAEFLNTNQFDNKPNLTLETLQSTAITGSLDLKKALNMALIKDNTFLGHSVIILLGEKAFKIPNNLEELREIYNFYNTPINVIQAKKKNSSLEYLVRLTDGVYKTFAPDEYVLLKNKKRHYFYLVSFKSSFYENQELEWIWLKLNLSYKGGNAMDLGGLLLGY